MNNTDDPKEKIDQCHYILAVTWPIVIFLAGVIYFDYANNDVNQWTFLIVGIEVVYIFFLMATYWALSVWKQQR